MPFEYVTTDAQATSELMGGDITAPTLAAIATRETFQVIAGTQSAHGRVEPRSDWRERREVAEDVNNKFCRHTL